MAAVAPNLSALIGDVVGARLISDAGSLTAPPRRPASTLQILGAEKALFRALKTKANTPKYGLISPTAPLSGARPPDKGRISRYLANKCLHRRPALTPSATRCARPPMPPRRTTTEITLSMVALTPPPSLEHTTLPPPQVTSKFGEKLRDQVEDRSGSFTGVGRGAQAVRLAAVMK